jgi:glycerol-3-phosphate cytidylyltransferase-like family protein
MKVGILTYHSVPNFGANLQAYSTAGYYKENGHEPIIINWVAKELDEKYGKDNPFEQTNAHRKFIEEYLPLSKLCRTTEEVAAIIKELDIDGVVIGSDVVLQHKTFLSRIKLTKRGIKIKQKRANITFPNPFWGSFIQFLDKKIPVSLMSVASQNMPYNFIRGQLKHRIG